ncbi:MAG: winged helix DNA-binding domain-containing protein [Acetatifactor sp.]|nr:winged helix DNA-binding domain-containing protein [Acetatifactor sp.]
MSELYLTKKEARRFILYKQGLLGDYRFIGKSGILDFIRQAGCIQFDPIDICGKNPEIVLQSRIGGFTKTMLYELLYVDRKLVDYFDKNLSIMPMEDWKYFERERENHRKWERSHEEIRQVHDKIIAAISEKGPLCSADLDISQKVDWYWSKTKLSRAALEHMYFTGELAVHHKGGNIKYYDLAANCIPEEILKAPDPCPDDFVHRKWRVLRRIGSLGLLWNRAADAWLGIPDLKAGERNDIFAQLLSEGRILPVKVEDIGSTLYCLTEDAGIAEYCKGESPAKRRCEFIAPLDNMMWDRNLIKEIFDFEYKWEIYTPQPQRKYGYYVLPILYGERLVGRIEMAYDRKERKLNVSHIWYEPGVRVTKKLESGIKSALKRFEAFNGS